MTKSMVPTRVKLMQKAYLLGLPNGTVLDEMTCLPKFGVIQENGGLVSLKSFRFTVCWIWQR